MFAILLLIIGYHVVQSYSTPQVETLKESDQNDEEGEDIIETDRPANSQEVLIQNNGWKLIPVRSGAFAGSGQTFYLQNPKIVSPTDVKISVENNGSYKVHVKSPFVASKNNATMIVSLRDGGKAKSGNGTVKMEVDKLGKQNTVIKGEQWVNSVKGDIKVDFKQHQSDGNGSYRIKMQGKTRIIGNDTSEPNRTLPAVQVEGDNHHIAPLDHNHIALVANNEAKSENSDSYNVNVSGGRRSSKNLLVDMTGDMLSIDGQKYHMDVQFKSVGQKPVETTLKCWTAGVDGNAVKLGIRMRRMWYPVNHRLEPSLRTYEATVRLKGNQLEFGELITATCLAKADDGRLFEIVLSLKKKHEH